MQSMLLSGLRMQSMKFSSVIDGTGVLSLCLLGRVRVAAADNDLPSTSEL
jgi:hypothetical protein